MPIDPRLIDPPRRPTDGVPTPIPTPQIHVVPAFGAAAGSKFGWLIGLALAGLLVVQVYDRLHPAGSTPSPSADPTAHEYDAVKSAGVAYFKAHPPVLRQIAGRIERGELKLADKATGKAIADALSPTASKMVALLQESPDPAAAARALADAWEGALK